MSSIELYLDLWCVLSSSPFNWYFLNLFDLDTLACLPSHAVFAFSASFWASFCNSASAHQLINLQYNFMFGLNKHQSQWSGQSRMHLFWTFALKVKRLQPLSQTRSNRSNPFEQLWKHHKTSFANSWFFVPNRPTHPVPTYSCQATPAGDDAASLAISKALFRPPLICAGTWHQKHAVSVSASFSGGFAHA